MTKIMLDQIDMIGNTQSKRLHFVHIYPFHSN